MACRICLDFRDGSAEVLTLVRRCSVGSRAALPALLLLAFGCATTPAREPPPAHTGRTEEAVAQARQDLEQVTRRLDAVASRSDDLENALARLGARIEALERRVEHLGALLAHARASSSPSAAGGSSGPPPLSSAPTPGSAPPGGVAQSTTTVEELYQAGAAKFRAKELDAAVLIFYDLITSYPSHPLREDAQFLVGDIFFSQKDLRGALREFDDLLAQVPNGSKTAETLLKIGLCQRGLGDEASARRTWQHLTKEHPQSVAARQARVLLRGSGRR